MWLVDNNVPRQVTHLLRDLGHDVLEVREVLAPDASDAVIASFARRSGRRVVTHDVRFARACQRDGIAHLWLRTPEVDDARRVRETIETIGLCFDAGAIRVTVTRSSVACEEAEV